MKNFKYYSLAAAGVSSVYGRNDAWDGETSNEIKFKLDGTAGTDLVFPMNVDVDGSQANKFYNVVDLYLGLFESYHFPKANGGWQYQATHYGASTEYNPTSRQGSATKGWNAIFHDERIIIAWEGDMLNCVNIGSNPVSDVVCSKGFAEEYCHRHGGEMFFPDDLFYEEYFKPMCMSKADRDAATDAELGANALADSKEKAASFSQDNYWMGLEKIVDPATKNLPEDQQKFNVRTSSHQHLLNAFNDNNIYTGWNRNEQVCNEDGIANCDDDHKTVYEWLIGTNENTSGTSPPNWFAHSEFPDVANHARIIGQFPNLNMETLLSSYLKTGGLQSQDCTYIRCRSGDGTVLQDTACDHNNIRPLCIMNDLVSPKRVCPRDVLSTNFPGEYHCGENVHQVLVAALYGRAGIADINNDIHSIHNYGEGVYGAEHTVSTTLHGKAVTLQMNYITSLRATLNDLGMGKAIPTLSLYTNCMGSYSNGKWVLTGADVKAICSMKFTSKVDGSDISYFEYNDLGNDQFEVKAHSKSTATTEFGKVGAIDGACQCEDCGDITFTDANAVQASAVRTESIIDATANNEPTNVAYFCCKDGYQFVPAQGYNYEFVATNVATGNGDNDTCDTECVKIKCQDEFTTDSEQQTLPFWTQGRALRDDQSGNLNYNIRKQWKHFSGAVHANQANIQGSCVPRACVEPNPANQPVNTVPVDHTGKTYSIGQTFTAQCSGEFCGSHTATCKQVADLNARGDVCLGSEWEYVGQCGAKTCSIQNPINGNAVTNTGILNGQTVTSQCNSGFIAQLADGTVVPGGVRTDTCTITDASPCNTEIAQVVVCVPVTCPAPPVVAGFEPPALTGDGHVDGTTVTYQCSANTCGVATSTCRVNGNTASWSPVTSASCKARYCVVQNGLVNGVAVNNVELNDNQPITLQCNKGFLFNGALTVTKTCDVPDTTELCSDPNGACCQVPIAPTEECTPVTCNIADACTGANFKPQTGTALENDRVTCECIDSLNLSSTQNSCEKVCTLDASGLFASFVSTGACVCEPPACPLPADIPHGEPITPTGGAITGTKIDVDGSITYKCDAGYSLAFSHNNAAATSAQCLRFCYVPPPNTCGTDRTDVNYSPQAPIAHLDPLNCYCKPQTCEAVPASWADHTLVNEEHRSMTHYYGAGFELYNKIEVQCDAPKFSATLGANSKETLTCGPTWTTPAPCVRVGCPNPRTATGVFTASVNLKHTCASLDQINLNPAAEGSSFESLATAGAVYSDQTTLPFGAARSGANLFTTEGGDGTTQPGNVIEGAKVRYTCKKGYSPYLNAVQAMAGGIDKQTGNSFECTCNNGVWVCNNHCRCQDACVNC